MKTLAFVCILVLLPVINANTAAGFGQITCAADNRLCVLDTGFCFCVPPDLVCDGINACPDGSDEVDCTCDPDSQFACKSGGCISLDLVCNGVKECQDRSDERGCECNFNQFKCSRKFQCIPGFKRCDGMRDCIDKTDEKDCVCTDIQIPCRKGGCVSATKRCDGFFDCQDRSDEKDCVCDKKTQFACKKGGCYSKKLRCDGKWDCQDGDDEKKCKCDKKAQFRCKSGGCIRLNRKCDMSPDCQDGSDEEDCEPVFRQSQIVTYLLECPEEFPVLHMYDRDIQYLNYRICNPGCTDARNMEDAYDIFSDIKQGLSFTDNVIAVELTFNPENGDVLPGFLVRKVCTTVEGAKSVSIFYQGEPILGTTFNIFRQVDITKVELRSRVCSSLYLIPQRVMVIMYTKAEEAAEMTIKGTFAEMCMRKA